MNLDHYHNLVGRVGNTPVAYCGTHNGIDLFIKLEVYNPSFSLKDRHTTWLLNDALEKGVLQPNHSKIIDTSSGSFSRSIALFGRALGCEVEIVLKNSIDPSFVSYMEAMGARAVLRDIENSTEGRDVAIEIAATDDRYVFLDQMGNKQSGQAHYETTAQEIAEAKESFSAAVIAMGSGATVWGVGRRFKELGTITLFASVSGDTREGKFAGTYSEGDFYSSFIEEIRSENLAEEVPVDYKHGIERARYLVRRGFDVGATAGGVYEAACKAIDSGAITTGPVLLLAGDGALPNWKKIFG